MAKSPKKSATLATFTVPMKVEVRAPEFEPLSSLAALDVDRLRRGKHKVEIGFLKGGCCRRLVRAVVEHGLVIGCEVEPCKETSDQPPPPELRAVLAKARKKVLAGRTWKPLPVAQLVGSSARMLDLLIIVGGGCIFICIFNHCIMCCWWPRPHCFVPVISTGPL